MPGGVGLQDEKASDAWGRQGGVQGQDLMWDPGLLRMAWARVGLHVPQVASDPLPELGEGPVDVQVGCPGRGGIGGRASGPKATRIRRTSSVVGQKRHVSRWNSTVAPPSASGRERRHRVHCSTGHPLSQSHHSWAWPSGPHVAGSSRSRRLLASSWMNRRWGAPRRAHGPELVEGRGGPGLGSKSPHRSREGGNHLAVSGGFFVALGKPRGLTAFPPASRHPPHGIHRSQAGSGSQRERDNDVTVMTVVRILIRSLAADNRGRWRIILSCCPPTVLLIRGRRGEGGQRCADRGLEGGSRAV